MANTRSTSGDPLEGTSLAGFASDLPGMQAFQRGDHPHLSGSHSASGRRPRKLSARRGGVRAAVRAYGRQSAAAVTDLGPLIVVPDAALKPAVAVKALVAYPRHVATSALTSVFIGLLAEHFNLKPVRDANIGAPAQSLAAVDFVLTSIG